MFKIFTLILLIVLPEIHADERSENLSLYCNYRLLSKTKESYASRIVELIPTREDKIIRDLEFLVSDDEDQNFKSEDCSEDNFKKIYEETRQHEERIIKLQKERNLEPLNDPYDFFCENCLKIFEGHKDPITQQAIYILLKKVNEELDQYLDRVSRTKAILAVASKEEEDIDVPIVNPIIDPVFLYYKDRLISCKNRPSSFRSTILPFIY